MDSKCSWRSRNCSTPQHSTWHMQTTGMGIHHAKWASRQIPSHNHFAAGSSCSHLEHTLKTTQKSVPPCSMRRAATTMILEVHTYRNLHQMPPGSMRKAAAATSPEVHLIPYHAAAPPDKTGASNVPPQAEPAEPTTKPRSQEARTPLYTPIQPTPTCQSSACTTCGRNRAAPPRPRRGRVQRASSQDSTTHRRNSEHSSKQATAKPSRPNPATKTTRRGRGTTPRPPPNGTGRQGVRQAVTHTTRGFARWCRSV